LHECLPRAYTAEIGRIIAKFTEDCDSATRNDQWFMETAKTSNVPLRTFYDWWNAFCQSAGLSLAPRQALDTHKEQFFSWLEEQQRQAEAEKVQKAAQAYERQRQQNLADAR
jgi:hypothetical protein